MYHCPTSYQVVESVFIACSYSLNSWHLLCVIYIHYQNIITNIQINKNTFLKNIYSIHAALHNMYHETNMEEYKEKCINYKNPNATDDIYCFHITMNMLVNRQHSYLYVLSIHRLITMIDALWHTVVHSYKPLLYAHYIRYIRLTMVYTLVTYC